MSEFIDWESIEVKGNRNGVKKTTCPKCSETRTKKKDPCLYVNFDSGVAKCFHCNALGFRDEKTINERVYTLPPQTWMNYTNISDNLVKWCSTERKIRQETLIHFRITEEKLGSYFALFISAILFGAMHLGNPNSSLIMAIGLAVQAGLLLASAYIYSRNLWFPIAIHFAWNFTQTAIFGANVSGATFSKTLITSKIEGAEWFTGGEFGPEGSIQATVFCLIATIILLTLSHKEGKIIKPYWMK
jgi:hypothetical protein